MRSMKKRRKIPSLEALRAFEVAARLLSFTEAAKELCVTQGAVSQRIKSLEADLGEALFLRGRNGLVLTRSGDRIARGVREAIDHIGVTLFADSEMQQLSVSVLPSFAHGWIMHRLPRLAQSHPALRVEWLAQSGWVDLREAGIDLAIRFAAGPSDGLCHQYLMGDSVVPVCAPGLLASGWLPRTPCDLSEAPILHDAPTERDASGTGWQTWLRQVGWPDVTLTQGQRFSQADLAIEAAARGLGVALARTSLIGDHLATGRLVRLPLPEIPTLYAYYLLWRTESAAATEDLRAWLLAEAHTAHPARRHDDQALAG